MSFKHVVAAAAINAAGLISPTWAADAPSIVLVHGAWANGSSLGEGRAAPAGARA
uniref:hypothetical protein n=1 Tax=Neorhizobium sp. EC2-8 TaxID=3129230 RepID=UPI003101AD46